MDVHIPVLCDEQLQTNEPLQNASHLTITMSSQKKKTITMWFRSRVLDKGGELKLEFGDENYMIDVSLD
jgi:hypothetical protein